jgi:glutathione S-transferase
MRLIFTPNPGYIHKVLVCAHESGVHELLQFERQVPFDKDTRIWEYNPLGKVPTLVLTDGSSLYGGPVICEYLATLARHETGLFPSGALRFPAKRMMMTGDGLFDATTHMRVEGWRAPAERHLDFMARERRKILGCLDQMERDAATFAAAPFHIGQVCFAGGLSYLAHRNPLREHKLEAGDAEFDWRRGRPQLARWYDSILSRPSIRYRLAWDAASGAIRQVEPPSS